MKKYIALGLSTAAILHCEPFKDALGHCLILQNSSDTVIDCTPTPSGITDHLLYATMYNHTTLFHAVNKLDDTTFI